MMKRTEYRCENCSKRAATHEARSHVNGVFQNVLVCASCLQDQKKSSRI